MLTAHAVAEKMIFNILHALSQFCRGTGNDCCE